MTGFKRFICACVAAAMLFLSIMIMYPGLFRVEKVDEVLHDLSGGTDIEGLESFPFYGTKDGSVYGIYNIFEECAPYITGESTEKPLIGPMLNELVTQPGAVQILMGFIILSLLSIPVYMVLRLIPFNTLYSAAGDCNFIARILVTGVTVVTAGVVTVCVTWFLYHSVVFKNLVSLLGDEVKNVQKPTIALNVTNVVIIIVAVLLVFAVLKTTLFRGSVTISILLGILRTLLFVIVFAFANVFSGRLTGRVILFAVIGIIAAGALKDLILPEKPSKKRKKRDE